LGVDAGQPYLGAAKVQKWLKCRLLGAALLILKTMTSHLLELSCEIGMLKAVELTKGGRKPNPKALLELMRRHDQEPVEMEGWTF
jgi:hypothetical protein